MIMFGQVAELRAKSSRFWLLLCLPHTLIAYGKKIFAVVEGFSKQLEVITRSSWPMCNCNINTFITYIYK